MRQQRSRVVLGQVAPAFEELEDDEDEYSQTNGDSRSTPSQSLRDLNAPLCSSVNDTVAPQYDANDENDQENTSNKNSSLKSSAVSNRMGRDYSNVLESRPIPSSESVTSSDDNISDSSSSLDDEQRSWDSVSQQSSAQ